MSGHFLLLKIFLSLSSCAVGRVLNRLQRTQHLFQFMTVINNNIDQFLWSSLSMLLYTREELSPAEFCFYAEHN